MKTTLEVDEALLKSAKEILGARTIKETVEKSLQAVVRQKALNELADLAGKVEMDMTVQDLLKMRKARPFRYHARR
jgi:Arc/MetJ family transcription regulator